MYEFYINNFKHMSSNQIKLVSKDKNEVRYNAKSKKFKTKQKQLKKNSINYALQIVTCLFFSTLNLLNLSGQTGI